MLAYRLMVSLTHSIFSDLCERFYVRYDIPSSIGNTAQKLVLVSLNINRFEGLVQPHNWRSTCRLGSWIREKFFYFFQRSSTFVFFFVISGVLSVAHGASSLTWNPDAFLHNFLTQFLTLLLYSKQLYNVSLLAERGLIPF